MSRRYSTEEEPTSKVARLEKSISMEEEIARLVAIEGMTFNQIANSHYLAKSFKRDGHTLPKSPNTIRECFLREYRRSVLQLKEKIITLKKSGRRFSLSFDESTSVRKRRYLSLNLHDGDECHSLGMSRVIASMPAEKAIQLVHEKLAYFGLDLDADIVSTITDGASVMLRVGRLTSPLHSTCLAHAIHLCVCDVMYQKRAQFDESDEEDDDEEDVEDEESLEALEAAEVVVVPELRVIIKKVRKIVKRFKNSE